MHDSHIHMALEPLRSNVREILEEFVSHGGKYILTQGTDILDYTETLDISKQFPDVVHVALGLHPTYFEENTVYKGKHKNISGISYKYIDEFEDIFLKNISNIKAVGETGLDYYQMSFDHTLDRDIVDEIKEIQRISFKRQVSLAIKHDLPISIHARDVAGQSDCIKDVLDIVAKEGKGILKGSFHSYTGSISFVQDILDLGFHIGFNAIITYKSGEDVRDILRMTPIERILFETDGPFLPPQSVRKDKKIKEKFAKPIHIKEIMKVASEVKNIPIEELEKITDESYENIFINH